MKLADLGLKTKPETKYFAGGYVSFYTENKELFFKIIRVTKDHQGTLLHGKVENEKELQVLLSVKTLTDITGVC